MGRALPNHPHATDLAGPSANNGSGASTAGHEHAPHLELDSPSPGAFVHENPAIPFLRAACLSPVRSSWSPRMGKRHLPHCVWCTVRSCGGTAAPFRWSMLRLPSGSERRRSLPTLSARGHKPGADAYGEAQPQSSLS